ncbi:glutamate-rich protein 3 isoform X6 [Meriones unguiculatus]|uniref:glutamate-rich protein 3 isoform X6 n=1 Tax=Meriones unguiculatus TaxID=10047 RepID=UPI00293EEC02|nr:glutamate-rich protein 3 isoform X6 [Meriones unguiculatus]
MSREEEKGGRGWLVAGRSLNTRNLPSLTGTLRLLATYNSLTDKHLAGYFNNTRIRRHLLRSGLITRSGRILSEKEYRVNIMKQDQQKYIRECLARAIFHKVLDMERHHQLEIKKKLDTLARKEQIQRLKGEHTRRFVEDNTPILTPHPPAGPKTHRGHSVLAEEGYSSPLALTAPRPYTAPGKMQPPIRLQPLLSHRTTRNSSKITSGSKPKASLLDAPFPIGGKKAMMKFRNYMDYSQREERYQLPNIHSYQIPVHLTPQPQTAKNFRESRLEPWRRKKLRPITAPNGLEPLFTRDPGRIYKIAPHSNAVITMAYFGKNVHLSYEDTDFRDEIKIYQQHCGGENLCVYSGKLLEKDVKTISPTSSRSHPYSSESEDELTEAGVEARSGTSAGSSQTSSSHDLQEHDQKKPHFPGEESLEAEIEEQEITKTDADKEPLSTEASYTHITEEEPVKETQEFTKSENENFRQPASPEANAKSPLQGEGAAMEEDRKAGLLEVEEEVGQIAGDAQAPVHDRSNAASGFSTAEGRVMAMRKPEAPLDRVEKEGRAMSSNEHPKQAAHEVCTLKEEAMEKDGFSQSGDADFYVGLKEEAGMEGGDAYHTQDADMNVGLREEAHVADVPLGERSPTGEQPAPAKESTGRVEHFLSIDNEAEAGTEGSSRLREEQLMPTGKVAAGSSVFLTVDQTLDRQRDVDSTRKALLQTAMEKEQPVSEGEQELEEAALTDSTKLSPGTLGDTAVLKEAGLSEVEAERKVGSSKQVEEQSKEGALTELEGMGSIADTAPEREDSSEVEILGGHKAAMEREDVLEAEAPLSSSRGEVWANPREVCQGNHEGLCKADIAREGVIADTELTLQQDLQAVLPGELAAAGDMEKAERPPVPLRETGSEREEVTEATVLKPEDLLKEQKAEGEEEGTEVSFEKEARASPDERKADAQEAESTSTTELGEATRLLGEPPKQEIVALLEATLHLGKPLEESEATEYKRQEGLPSQQSEAMSQPFRVPNHDGEGLIEAPGPEPADKALPPESFSTAGSEEWPSEELDSHAEVERLDGGRPLQVQGGDIMKVTQGNLLEERLTKAGLFSREAEGAKLQEEQDGARESPPGTQPDSLTGQSGAMGGDTVEAEEGLQTGGLEETAAAQGMVSTESESAGGDSEASSSADARKETWGTAGETPGESAAEERAVAEDMAPGTTKEKAREVQDSRPGKGREAGDTEAFQHAGTAGEEAGTRLLDAGQQAGAAEVFRGSVSQRALELSRACLEAAPPRKLDFSRTQQNPLEKLQGEHEGADIPVTTAE